ncbi:MAG: biotin transporter BioY [Clostridia bacterium]|nr:biotin transporter BioY [Clostridia bacterium]
MKEKALYKVCRAGLFAAIICVCSFIAFPVGPVPVTLSLCCIMLAGIALSPLEAFAATLVYVIIGAVGLPVFSGGSGGIGVLLGPTGGYIWSYPLCALTISLISHIKANKKLASYVLSFTGCMSGTFFCYCAGTVQYMLLTNASFYTALVTCIIPFVAVDIIKSFAATVMGISLKKKLKRL